MNSQIDWDAEHRRTLLESNATLERTTQSLTRSHIVATENEQIGTEVISELEGQRERLLRAKRRLSQTDEELNKTRRILNRMRIGVLTNKFVLVLIILLEILILAVNIMELQENDQSEDTAAMGHIQFDLEMDSITETAVYYSTTPRKSLRGKRKKTMDGRPQSQTSLLKSNYNVNGEQKIGPKYRPIWPKPYQPNYLNKPKIFGLSSTMNEFSTLNPASRIIVTTTTSALPAKEKIQDSMMSEKPSKRTHNYSKSTTANSNSLKLLTKENVNNKNYGKNCSTSRKDFRFIQIQDKDNKGSIELFFESMAQTVLSLPMHVQAQIKMEICKLVTMAEIKYSSMQSKHGYKID